MMHLSPGSNWRGNKLYDSRTCACGCKRVFVPTVANQIYSPAAECQQVKQSAANQRTVGRIKAARTARKRERTA